MYAGELVSMAGRELEKRWKISFAADIYLGQVGRYPPWTGTPQIPGVSGGFLCGSRLPAIAI
jgi:hypothetical protein